MTMLVKVQVPYYLHYFLKLAQLNSKNPQLASHLRWLISSYLTYNLLLYQRQSLASSQSGRLQLAMLATKGGKKKRCRKVFLRNQTLGRWRIYA